MLNGYSGELFVICKDTNLKAIHNKLLCHILVLVIVCDMQRY